MKFDFKKVIKNKKTIIIAAVAFLLMIIICVCAGISAANPKTTIAFYGLPEDVVKNFENTIDGVKTAKGKQFYKVNYVELDSETPLTEMKKPLKKVDMVISYDGLNVKSLGTKYSFDGTIVNEMTSSMQTAKGVLSKGKVVTKLPLLLDHLELTIDRDVKKETNVGAIASWAHLENFCEKTKEVIKAPMIFAGNDELFVLDIIGAFCEGFSGRDTYEKAVKIIDEELKKANKKGETPNYIKLAQTLAEKKGSPLYDGISYMNKLYRAGYFTNAVFSFNENAVHAYMDADNAALVLQYLSSHRKASLDALKRYDSTYFISNIAAVNRSFTAPMICAVPLSKNKKSQEIAKFLVSQRAQESLSRYTGLAPVLTSCATPDREADDVRYWVAATNAPLNGLSKDAFLYKSQAKELEKMLVNYILR